MKVIVDLCVVPIGVGLSVSKYIAECEKIIKKAGLKSMLHAMVQISKENGMMFLPQ